MGKEWVVKIQRMWEIYKEKKKQLGKCMDRNMIYLIKELNWLKLTRDTVVKFGTIKVRIQYTDRKNVWYNQIIRIAYFTLQKKSCHYVCISKLLS